MTQSIFITGTDTGVGKTYVACRLIREYVAQGYKVVGMKPVAAGCEWIDGQWVNEDVALLTAASNVSAPKEFINPYCFTPPIAPHIAAEQVGVTVDMQVIKHAYDALAKLADIVVVEGAGGLLVPLNADETIADLIQLLNLPVVLVVGLKLGCINHTALTLGAMEARAIELKALVMNDIGNPMPAIQENIATISNMSYAKHRINSLNNYSKAFFNPSQ
jgi:dethiobiotin synthetase